jgi:hypothetical protein
MRYKYRSLMAKNRGGNFLKTEKYNRNQLNINDVKMKLNFNRTIVIK